MPRRLRWLVALAGALGCAALLIGVRAHPPIEPASLHSLNLLLITLAGYAWIIFAPLGSVLINLMLVTSLGFAWARVGSGLVGIDLGWLIVLIGAAAWQKRRRHRRRSQLVQKLDDLEEELVVKQQALRHGEQTRESLQKKLSRYQRLQAIAEQLSNLLDLGGILTLAVDQAFELIGKSDVCLLFFVDTERQELALAASKKSSAIASIRTKRGDQFDQHVLRTHRPLLVNDVRRDFRFTIPAARERTIGAVIACPLVVGNRAEGVLRLDSAQPGAYTQDDLRFLDILLGLVGTAVANARLFSQTQQLAMTDGLTQLYLRRPFLEHLERELLRANRTKEATSVLMIDIDHFKHYNDTFGHTAGDLVLKGVAEVLRVNVPPEGISARLGGEEFAVLLPRSQAGEATKVADRIRQAVERHMRQIGRVDGHRVTVSIGVSAFPHDATSELELLRVADTRLYEAKRGGRNRVCAA